MRRTPRALLAVGFLLTAAATLNRPVAIHLAGDSTVAEKRADRRPETGWGERLEDHFRAGTVRVVNHAANGRSTRTFISEGRWQRLLDSLQAGDYVFIQFGHNDASREKVDRYTPPADYRANLVRFVRDVRSRRAIPVLFTPVSRRKFDSSGMLVDTHGEYPDLVREVGRELRVHVVDAHRATAHLLRRLGVERSKRLFLHLRPDSSANYPQGLEDNTHFSPAGAQAVACIVTQGLRSHGLSVARYLRATPDCPRLRRAGLEPS